MTISYNWLNEYLPEVVEPERLSKILTSVGLEVESLEHYENLKGGLKGLVVGEVLECEQHPNADKLKITKVDIANGEVLQIVCGASNVAIKQKVIVATVGSTIYPFTGDPILIKAAKIRGTESNGMICAEDEIGLSNDHGGIIVLPGETKTGTPAAEVYKIYSDWVYEIGLTPNRMDAMSHLGVAKDVCAYLSHHTRKRARPKHPNSSSFKVKESSDAITVLIENKEACRRYCGVSIRGIVVKESPEWLQNRLKAISVRPVNNVVDITNFILHETGQPLHAFDENEIKGKKIIVRNLPGGTVFKTLDDKDRILTAEDLMICNEEQGMCIAGIFGGIKSGIKEHTTSVFLESAWFNPVAIRRSSLHHGLRTDAATRFEKNVDISNCLAVLKRAALMIKEIAGGEITGEIVDVYPAPKEKIKVALKNHYLKKLSGKNYHPDSVKNILESLDFEIIRDGIDELLVAVPFSNADISLPADIVEEIIRIDGIDNIEIPSSVTLSPAVEELIDKEKLREKIAEFLVGNGFNEILTNSITNSAYYDEEVLTRSVKMMNNLSAELNTLRPSMLETALESIGYNINRRSLNLSFFEFGKTYAVSGTNQYQEKEHISLLITGDDKTGGWRAKARALDFYSLKGLAAPVLALAGITDFQIKEAVNEENAIRHDIYYKNTLLGSMQNIRPKYLQRFDIKQPVFFMDLDFSAILKLQDKNVVSYKEISKFPVVDRDLAVIVDQTVAYGNVEHVIRKINLPKLLEIKLFDVFESEKLGTGKKSMAVNLVFGDDEKTLTDKETDGMMQKIIAMLEKELNADIRK
ncbi:MAG TPA: phenylalanine--tRNA ligase subunit beta [Panacibacter sp.]|nr:phenylalanine--tRNA ligase subunit beta [Panacibacter sp.]HNP46890.1 phenylalanine--tRNA ligase subunit beta [Panacibacter sp.]